MYDDPAYIPALLDICRIEQIDIVLPLHHEDLVQIAPRKVLFEEAGFGLPIPDYSLIELAIDKYRMAKLADRNGIPGPKTFLQNEITPKALEQSVGFPILVKLRNSTGQRGQKKVSTPEELEAHTRTLLERHGPEEIILQEYIAGTVRDAMYTVGLLYDHNHELKACVPLKKIRSRPYTGGTAICTKAEHRLDLQDMSVRLMSAVGKWTGIADIEIKIDPSGKPRFIELNPRPWGSIYGAYAAGVDFPLLWVKTALHEDLNMVEEFHENIYASFLSRDLALLRDLVGEFVRGPRGEGGAEVRQVLKTYYRPYLRRNKNAHVTATSDFILDDPVPFIRNLARFMGIL